MVNRMKELGISVDIYGNCGKGRPELAWEKYGKEAFYQKYRFYLSFENSFCDDYVTEKLYNGLNSSLQYGLIPLVYGSSNYSEFLPRQSFIDVNDFSNVENLVKFLFQLKNSSQLEIIEQYYQWHFQYHLSNIPRHHHYYGWQTLCRNIWNRTKVEQSPEISNLKQLLGDCHISNIITQIKN